MITSVDYIPVYDSGVESEVADSTPDVELIRLEDDGYSTIGALRVDGAFVCLTLEEPWRDNQPNVSCIPVGDYRFKLEYSPSKARNLWTIKGVPGRSYVRVHKGNSVADTEGCPLTVSSVKHYKGRRWGYDSTGAFQAFIAAMGDRKSAKIRVRSV